MTSNKVAIYCRLSEEDKNKKNKSDDSGSIQNQKLMLTEYANNQNWQIFDIYSDDDYAGSDRNRPAFNRMITDAMSKKFNIILCKTQSRFTRELEIVEKYIHNLFPQLGIRFVSIVDNIDTDVRGNKKARQINGLINEWYLEDMSESIKSALRTRMKAGYFIGSFAPYGYKKDPENKGHLIIDDEVAPIIKEIFSLYVSGTGRTSIARILNQRGVPSPCEYYRLKGIKKDGNAKSNGSHWKYYTVSHILENEVYIGNLIQGQTYNPTYKSKHSIPAPESNWVKVENTHEPIIDIQTWNLTRELWTERSKSCYDTKQINLFAGKLVCTKCGYKMTTAYNKKKRYYRCNNAIYGKKCCEGTSIFESTLLNCVLDELNKLRDEFLDENAVLKSVEIKNEKIAQIKSLKQQVSSVDQQIEHSNLCLKNLYVDKIKEEITQSQFQLLSAQFNDELEALTKQKVTLENQIVKLEQQQTDSESIKKRVLELLQFKEISRSLVQQLIEKIEIGGTKFNRIVNIHWKF